MQFATPVIDILTSRFSLTKPKFLTATHLISLLQNQFKDLCEAHFSIDP